jgi:hypothetical protein
MSRTGALLCTRKEGELIPGRCPLRCPSTVRVAEGKQQARSRKYSHHLGRSNERDLILKDVASD